MKSVTAKIDIGATHIQDRLKVLAAAHSQSELARRTGVPVSNVNRYVSGEARVPAEFCGALVKHLGVNPAWLLTGEGAVLIADVTAGTSAMAGDMLELVEALNAVSHMRLGSLTGKHHLRVLRELNEALGTYETLRKRLDERSGGILRQLIDDVNRATTSLQLETAADLRKAAVQIAQFSHDGELLRALRAAESNFEFAMGNAEAALEMSREVFARTLTRTDLPNSNTLIQAHNLAASLCQNFRFREARRVCRMALALAGDDLPGLDALHELRTLHGVIEMEMGNLEAAAPELMAAWPQTRPLYKEGSLGMLQRAMLLAGMISFEQAADWGRRDLGRSRQLTRLAIWYEDPARLTRVQKQFIGLAADQAAPNVLESVQAALLLHALETGRKPAFKPLAELEKAEPARLPRAIAELLRSLYAAQLLLCMGERKAAAAEVVRTERMRLSLAPDLSLDFLASALHRRNALRALDGGPIYDQAREFMAAKRRCGYAILPAPGEAAGS